MIRLVAEIGINHNGSEEVAGSLIDAAAAAGWGYVKFQKRNPSVCVPESQRGRVRDTPWGRMTYLEYKNRIELSASSYESLFSRAESLGVSMFASVFDLDSLEFMSERSDIVKVGSANITDLELCRAARRMFGTLIVSTGMSTEEQVDECVRACEPDVVMHSVSCYPCSHADLWLNRISWMRRKYPGIEIGYSGHESGIAGSMAAVALGASWIERHVTLDRDMWGSDQSSSMEPSEMEELARGVAEVDSALKIPAGNRMVLDCEREKQLSTRTT